jgi:hypothetical protein
MWRPFSVDTVFPKVSVGAALHQSKILAPPIEYVGESSWSRNSVTQPFQKPFHTSMEEALQDI